MYAISDIHGHYDKLVELIEKISPQKDDVFIFAGDYIDRGKHSCQVIEYLIEFSKQYKCIFLKGNHEDMFLHAYCGNELDKMIWKKNGGSKTIKSYKGSLKNIPFSHLQFFKNLQLYYEDEQYIIVHAGIVPNKPMEEQIPEDIMWIREEFINQPTGLSKKVIYGHTREQLVKNTFSDKIAIDTGVSAQGHLSAIKLPEEIFISV